MEQPGRRLLQLQRVDAPDDWRAGLVWCFLVIPMSHNLVRFQNDSDKLHFPKYLFNILGVLRDPDFRN